MRILLLGEYSRLHLTLAEKLREEGHFVLLVSDGDGYKNYERDIDISRNGNNLIESVRDTICIVKRIRSFKNFDVVQLINPCFTTLNARVNKYLFNCLAKNNKRIYLGAFGVDSVWLNAAQDHKLFRYSEFQIFGERTNITFNAEIEKKWKNTYREVLNKYIAKKCNGIIACLYEYYEAYKQDYNPKLSYIPLPINIESISYIPLREEPEKVCFFIGIDSHRQEFKGSDKLLKMLNKLKKNYPEDVEVIMVESIPYNEYIVLMQKSHVVLDQIYSYSPSVNPLQAMAMGKIVVSGGEPEIYALLQYSEATYPILNVLPQENDIYRVLEYIIKHKDMLPTWSEQSRKFVETYHDANKVAKQYVQVWGK